VAALVLLQHTERMVSDTLQIEQKCLPDETLISASARKPEAGAVCGDAVPFVVATIVVDDPLVDVG